MASGLSGSSQTGNGRKQEDFERGRNTGMKEEEGGEVCTDVPKRVQWRH